MAVAHVQNTPGDSSSGASSIATAVFGAAVSASNCIICFAMYYRAAGAVTTSFSRVGDPAGTTVYSYFDAGSSRGMAAGYITGIAANTNAMTATFSSAVDADRGAWAVEVSGAASVPFGEAIGAYNAAPSGTDGFSTGNGSPTVAPGLKLAVGSNFHSGTMDAGTGFTSRGTAWSLGFGLTARLEDAAYSSTGSQAGATWTGGVGDFGPTIVAYIRQAVAASVTARRTRQGGIMVFR